MSETGIELDLLEREDELATLTSLVAATERGEGSLAVIETCTSGSRPKSSRRRGGTPTIIRSRPG
jgi:hypothetical protein